MPVVQYTSKRNLPTTGTPGQINNLPDPIGAALNPLAEAAVDLHDRDQKARISEIETEFSRLSREKYYGYATDRRGKAALRDNENDTPSVYEDYSEFANKWTGEQTANFSGPYQDLLTQRLAGISSSYQGKVSIFQAGEHQAHRQSVVSAAVLEAGETVKLGIAPVGAGPEVINEEYRRLSEIIDINSSGRDMTGKKAEIKQALTEQAVLAKMISNPVEAQGLLDDVRDEIPPGTYEILKGKVDKKVVERKAKDHLLNVAGLPYEEQLTYGNDEISDGEVKADFFTRVNAERTRQESERLAKGAEKFLSHYDKVWDGEATLDWFEENVEDDPDLEPGQKDYLRGVISNPGKVDKEKKDLAAYQAYLGLKRDIFLNRPGVEDAINKALAEMEISPSRHEKLTGLISEATKSPDLGPAWSNLQGELNDILADPEEKSQFSDSLINSVMQERARQGRAVGYNEIMDIGRKLADPIKDRRWYHLVPFISTPDRRFQVETPDGVAPTIDATLMELKDHYPESRYDYRRNLYILGRDESTGRAYAYDPARNDFRILEENE